MLDFERLNFFLSHLDSCGQRVPLASILGPKNSNRADSYDITVGDTAIVRMYTDIGDHVHVLPLHIAPILHAEAPHVALTLV